jgi:Putative zinc-finger
VTGSAFMLAGMEGTPLRSVPARLPSPVDPARAVAVVARVLPELQPEAQRAIALVDLVELPRAAVAEEIDADLGRVLAQGRKALRRTVAQLPADGWCERAERQISDRIDGALSPAGEARLEAHLRGCERCESHEQGLAQARDRLVMAYLDAYPPAAPAAIPPPPELRVVEPIAGQRARIWHVAFVVGILLAVAAVVLALLAVTGAVHVP